MIDKHDELYNDFEAVKQIPIIPTMLDVVCRLTGMGFAAVARVTEDRWVACSVKDEVNFGLAEGGELKIETTICNEIRDSRKEVVIDHVEKDEHFRNHHTPKMYGLQSYISYPIILKNGSFFGTLCAIDSKPAILNRPEVLGTFKLFAELLAFHLESVDLIDRSYSALKESNKILEHTNIENSLYKQISNHNIQEQVRKIGFFSSMLADETEAKDAEKIHEMALRINSISLELSNMIKHVTRFSEMKSLAELFKPTDLNLVLSEIKADMATSLAEKNISVTNGQLPVVAGIESQLKELFFQLINHAVMFSTGDKETSVNIYSKNISSASIKELLPEQQKLRFCEITVEQPGIGTNNYNLNNVFDIFLHLTEKQHAMRYGAGLAYCGKIVYNHGGLITAKALPGAGVSFSIILPLD